jgi:hypothetical protein
MDTGRGRIWAGGLGTVVCMYRVALTAAMALVAVNIWTGSPIFALWVGSQVQGGGHPRMESVAVVAVVMTATSLVLIRLLAVLGRRHDELTGNVAQVRTHVPWLRSMRGERPLYPGEKPRITALERVLVVTVVLATIAFQIWFLFFSGSPFDSRSGR